MSLKTRAILVLVIGTVMGLGLSLGGDMLAERKLTPPGDLSFEQAQLIEEVMDRVKRDYIDPVDDQQLVESAIRAMVSELDRHSQFLDEHEYKDIQVSTTGSYSGVGIEVSTENDDIVVVAPIDGTPAQRAGIRSGDRIIAIDDHVVGEETLSETIGRMRGRSGTHVILTVERSGANDALVFNLRREQIKVASVRHEMLSPDFGYTRISQFTDTTAAELSDAVTALDEQEISGLIIDLRNNPGGILDAAVDVSDLFLETGVIVTADGRTPEARFSRDASGDDILSGRSIVVLVNEGSASASEIVAGALQDHHRATVIGTKTFGKGLVQTVMPLSRGRAIKLTTSRYYTPSGDSIHETGIEPDIIVEGDANFPGYGLSETVDREQDTQLMQAIDYLRHQRVMHSDAG